MTSDQWRERREPVTNDANAVSLMIAILLCAGFGTRLRPLTDATPKALLEVGGRPIIDYLMEQIIEWPSLDAVHCIVNDRDVDAFARWQTSWQPRLHGLRLHLHNDGVRTEDERLGAVGDLQFVLRQIGTQDGALVAAGDSLYRASIRPLEQRFQHIAHHLVLAFHQTDPKRLTHASVFDLTEEGRVRGVVHTPDEPPSSWVSPACYLLQPSGLRHVSDYLNREGDPDTLGRFIDDLAQYQRVEAFKLHHPEREEDLRFHINTPEQYRRANAVLEQEPALLGE